MKKLTLVLLLLLFICVPVSAAEIVAPEAPDHVQDMLPEDRDSFAEGLWYVVRSSIALLRPDIASAFSTCFRVIGVVLLISLLRSYEGTSRPAVELAGVVILSLLLLEPANTLISLATETVRELSDYAKLLLPVMTAALSAQGGTVTAAGLYTATAVLNAALSSLISALLVPMIYIFLVLSIVNAAAGDGLIKKLRDFIKWLITWALKLALYGFTAYISITGVISGTADQAALKATKLTISGMVPVVGGILSDASESILIGAGVVKNSAGIYGLFAILAIAVLPFFRIGLQYLLVKLTGAICAVFADKQVTGVIDDFSGAMGLLLATTGTLCLILLISIVCFLKGVG